MKNRKIYLSYILLAIVVISFALAASSPIFEFKSYEREEEQAQGKYEESQGPRRHVKLTWAHSAVDSRMKNSKEQIAKRYMKMHPEVEIDIVLRHPKDYNEWIKAKLASNSPIDIISVDSREYRSILDWKKGYVVDLKPFLEKKNPYTERIWKEEFTGQQIFQDRNGYITAVPYQMMVSKFVYNKSHFADAGINDIPLTWQDFTGAMEKLKAKGYIPFGAGINDSNELLMFLNSLFMDQVYYSELARVDVFTKDGRVQENEMARAVDKGILDLKHPDLEKVLAVYKKFKSFWNNDFMRLNNSDIRTRFIDGKVSVILGSSWDIPDYSSNPKLDWGILPFPVLDRESIPSSPGKSLEIAPIQDGHAVTVQCRNNGNMGEAVDFLMSFSTYETFVVQDTAVDEGSGGTKSGYTVDRRRAMHDQFMPSGESIPYITPILFTFGDSSMMDEIYRSTLLFLDGQLSSGEFVEILSVKARARVLQVMKERKWSGDNNYGEWFAN